MDAIEFKHLLSKAGELLTTIIAQAKAHDKKISKAQYGEIKDFLDTILAYGSDTQKHNVALLLTENVKNAKDTVVASRIQAIYKIFNSHYTNNQPVEDSNKATPLRFLR
jgi:hypothetical protein